MMKSVAIATLLVSCLMAGSAVLAFSPLQNTHRQSMAPLAAAKGFGKAPANKDATAKPLSEGQKLRKEQSAKYDELAATGGQEYNIYVRQFGGDDKSWLPCGSIAVPRGAQVSDAIFANQENLNVSIVRTFPKLKGYEAEFEYGYNLKLYKDDPVEVATKSNRSSGPSIGNWISNLLSPIDASQAKR